MDGELNTILKKIKERTGIDVDIFSPDLKFCVSTRKNAETATLPPRTDFSDVLTDENTRKTYFRFKVDYATLFGSIYGCGEVEKNYAYFILSYLDSALEHDEIGRGEFLRNVLMRGISHRQCEKFVQKFSIPSGKCFVLAIKTPKKQASEVFRIFEKKQAKEDELWVFVDEETVALLKFVSGDDENSLSKANLADSIYQTVLSEKDFEVSIGIGNDVSELFRASESFAEGLSALKIAEIFQSNSIIHFYNEYFIAEILNEIPRAKLREYLDIFSSQDAKDIFSDEDMLSMCECFFENNLNISMTARDKYMHRNTLMYRLDKIEKATGLDLRKFSDAVTFRIITVLMKLVKN